MKNLCLISSVWRTWRRSGAPTVPILLQYQQIIRKYESVTSSVGKSSSKNHKGSNIWCHYCDKNNHNTADCRAIAKFKQQKKTKACFEAKAGRGKMSLAFLFLFEEINTLTQKATAIKA
jgi:hypothetical protein